MFNDALIFTLQNEGFNAYTNDPNDKGGATKWGISKRSHPDLDIENLTFVEAQLIYRKEYWNAKYNSLDRKLAIRLFDVGVNIGVSKAVRILQETLNKYFEADLKTDGKFGLNTLRACNSVTQRSLYSTYVFEVSLYYKSLNSNFLKGWLNRLYREIT